MSEPKVEQWRLPDENMKPLIKQWRATQSRRRTRYYGRLFNFGTHHCRVTIDAYAAREPDSGEPKENYMLDIGTARRALFVEGTHNWNGWSDITAEVEVTGEFVDAKKVLQGLGKKLRDVAMRNQLASDQQGAFMPQPPETPAEEATCPMCAKPVFETVETPAGDEQAREVATKLIYSVSKWAGRSPEFMQMMVAKWNIGFPSCCPRHSPNSGSNYISTQRNENRLRKNWQKRSFLLLETITTMLLSVHTVIQRT